MIAPPSPMHAPGMNPTSVASVFHNMRAGGVAPPPGHQLPPGPAPQPPGAPVNLTQYGRPVPQMGHQQPMMGR